jgi:hypothetical protein
MGLPQFIVENDWWNSLVRGPANHLPHVLPLRMKRGMIRLFFIGGLFIPILLSGQSTVIGLQKNETRTRISSIETFTPVLPIIPSGNIVLPGVARASDSDEDPSSDCVHIWGFNLPVEKVPPWLTTPSDAQKLSKDIPIGYLSTSLIRQGAVSVSHCQDGGFLDDGQASSCGSSSAISAVSDWQTQFDTQVLSASRSAGIPARVLTTVLSGENSAWPGITVGQPSSALGQMTNNGADTALLWNQNFYRQFCPTVFTGGRCALPYALLSSTEKMTLQQTLVARVQDAFCPDCALGMDLHRSSEAMNLFAQTLKANCAQAGAIIDNIYGGKPANRSSYVDLWRFTLVNFHSGPGCLAHAIDAVRQSTESLDWTHHAEKLSPACQEAKDFVEGPGFSAELRPSGPNRYAVVAQSNAIHRWQLTRWADHQGLCLLRIDHDEVPNGEEIRSACGDDLYSGWQATPPCKDWNSDTSTCSGYYLIPLNTESTTRFKTVALPEASVWITLKSCMANGSAFSCSQIPQLVLHSQEPLTGQSIIGLTGQFDGKDFFCPASCLLTLDETGKEGVPLDFWSTSSYGDTSRLFQARIRVSGNQSSGWIVTIVSDPQTSCSVHPVGGAPDWLSTPDQASDLSTKVQYVYLAAALIRQGAVNVSACPDSGLRLDGNASICGLAAANSQVVQWQNQFDGIILNTANQVGVPARLIKGLFARESQFWPGFSADSSEAGLGQMTDNGADTLLLWNRTFFTTFCPTRLDSASCLRGYASLPEASKKILRHMLVLSVSATCKNCALGIDPRSTEKSISVFGSTIQANCQQSGAILGGAYAGSEAGWTTYADAWRFSLLNYNAGPGCLIQAVSDLAKDSEEPLDWSHLSDHLPLTCQGGKQYVEAISGGF